ncbi:MAG: glycoside hydrolase family 78 protein, partial [Alteraurantiacibacter sp.]|nr:glycoside hydrolase family 78 protein [Alteraurantiacibacter sp.]
KRQVYGATTALLAQLELHYADGQRQIVPTDETWRAGEGQVRMADLYNGCRIDHAREPTGWTGPDFDDGEWSAVECLPLPRGLRQRAMPPVRVVDTFSVNPIGAPDLLHADCGQNLTGWLRLTVEAQCGGVVDVRHAEVLEPDGGLHLSSLRTAEARDRYMVRAGRHELEPAFTYHGFRHAEIACAPGIEIVACEARVVSSDLRRIGHFRCSDERVNRLYENIIWSQRGNFLAIPTDCPQRDERLGWTGDIQVFAPTACTNFDCRTFLGQWLADLAAEQRADGNVPSTVPNVLQGHLHEYGGVGWGDAATLVPWAMYEAYGDAAILARQYASMKAWVDYGLSRLDANGLWIGDFQLGDWLDPAAPPGYPEQATTDRDFIATAYLAHSARTLGKAAGILGHAAQADFYRDRAERLAQACWQRWQKAVLATQTGCAMAICFDIAPPSELLRIGARLARLVEVNHGRIGTGFLGTPLVLPALTRTGQHAAALRLLLNPLAPGWLYQVEMGATTIWERWDAIRPDGSIHPGDMAAKDSPGMMSFNHYAYGSVGCWLYRTLAGIAPAEPGYAVIDFAPQPGEGIDWAEARIETPFGMAAVSWRRSGKALSVCCQVPPGARGRFIPPSGWRLAGDALPSFGSGDVTFSLLAEAG